MHLAREPSARPDSRTVLKHKGVADAPFDAFEYRQRPPARARRARSHCDVAERVADEWHCVVVEPRHDHAPALARLHRAPLLVDKLDDGVLNRQVILMRFRTLDR